MKSLTGKQLHGRGKPYSPRSKTGYVTMAKQHRHKIACSRLTAGVLVQIRDERS